MGAMDTIRDLLGINVRHDTGNGEQCLCELATACGEYNLRRLAYATCVNMVAGALGRCEMRTFRRGREVREAEYYLWNVSPNVNENSTEFWHHAVKKLYERNELLILETREREDGLKSMVVADDWTASEIYATKQMEYTGVRVGATEYKKTFREGEVIHVRMNAQNIRPVLEGIAAAYDKVLAAAEKAYRWQNGAHIKVKIAGTKSGEQDFEEKLKAIIEKQVKPFFDADAAILPEFAGYEYGFFGTEKNKTTPDDITTAAAEIWKTTAQAFGIPSVLIEGKVEGTADAHNRFLTGVIDPLCDQIAEEANRKCGTMQDFIGGTYMLMDSSNIIHFDIFAQAAAIEKLIGSGIKSVNDIERMIGSEIIHEDWADKHYMTLNIGQLTEAGQK